MRPIVVRSEAAVAVTVTATIAMLVIGGMPSLWGADMGVIVVPVLNHALGPLESGLDLGGVIVSLPSGSRLIIVSLVMIVVLIFRPGGREARRPRSPSSPSRSLGTPNSLFLTNANLE